MAVASLRPRWSIDYAEMTGRVDACNEVRGSLIFIDGAWLHHGGM